MRQPADVQRVLEALKAEDMNERVERLRGRLLGILPETRRFECRLEGGKLITGKVDRSVLNINAFKGSLENKSACLEFRVVTLRSNERFLLTGGEASDAETEGHAERV